MIDEYVKKLVDNLPIKDHNDHIEALDIVLSGGAFNGSYLAGALSFIKEMERRSYVKIERISGCSVGAIGGLLYLIDGLDLVPKIYESVKTHFKCHFTLETLKSLRQHLEIQNRLPDNLCECVNGKLFVCYYDLKYNRKIVRSTYKNVDDVMETIIRSCYVPFLIDHQILYKNRYMDGVNAYMFHKKRNRKILHLELMSLNKWAMCCSVKNEINNFQRILEGLLDIHSFYIRQRCTSMCSFVENWSWNQQVFYSFKFIIERISVKIVKWLNYLWQFIPHDDNVIIEIIKRVFFDIFSIFVERNCF